MESEERPPKIRKLEQDPKDNSTNEGHQASPQRPLEPGQGSNDQENAAATILPMSKNALKKLRKRQKWEASRDDRIAFRKEKKIAAKERKRQKRAEGVTGADGEKISIPAQTKPPSFDIPMTFLLDCGFDQEMTEKEIMSISVQITRSYSENRKAQYRPVFAISSFGGRLKTRFETAMKSTHERWSQVHIEQGDFAEVSEKAKEWMQKVSPKGLEACSALAGNKDSNKDDGEVVYLTADSDETLKELKPYSTYIIGGIVDRNRHKGICYKRAKDKKIRTAKLPIGEFMQMNSRAVLATNHVYEIMLRWLEVKDWGEAFMKVIPKRKGGVLRDKDQGENLTDEADEAEGRSEGGNVRIE